MNINKGDKKEEHDNIIQFRSTTYFREIAKVKCDYTKKCNNVKVSPSFLALEINSSNLRVKWFSRI